MSLEDRIKAVDAIETVSERDAYAWAYTSFHSDINVIKNLNKLIEKLFEELESQTTARVLSKDLEEELINYATRLVKTNRILKKQALKNAYLSIENKGEFERLLNETIIRRRGIDVIRDMDIVYIVSLFEGYLQKVLQVTFAKKPEALKSCQKNISYQELLDFKNIKIAKKRIVEKEIEIVNEDIEVVNEYFQKKFNIDMSKFVDWKEFKERFYRRNIIIHNSGVPNKVYRSKTGYSGGNEKMTVSKTYLDASIDMFETMSQKVGLALEEKIIGYKKTKK
jgi:hypothetical protein